MAYNQYSNNYNDTDESKLAWDSRQFYSRFGESYVIKFCQAEDTEVYPSILKCLDRWYYAIKQEWVELNEEDEEYFNLRDNLIKASMKHREVWYGRKFNAEGVHEIDFAVQKMKNYLLTKMKKSGVFGSEWDDDGL